MLRIDKDEGASPVASPTGFDSTTFRTVSARNSTYWFEIAADRHNIDINHANLGTDCMATALGGNDPYMADHPNFVPVSVAQFMQTQTQALAVSHAGAEFGHI